MLFVSFIVFFILSQCSAYRRSVLHFFLLQYTVAAIICQSFTYCIFQQIFVFFFVLFYYFLFIDYLSGLKHSLYRMPSWFQSEKDSTVSVPAEPLVSFCLICSHLFHAESRTTRRTGIVVTFGTSSPFRLRSIYSIDSSDISSIGWWIVVIAGVVSPAITVSSKPTFSHRMKALEYLCGNQVTACKNAVRLRVLQKALFNIGFIVHGAVA